MFNFRTHNVALSKEIFQQRAVLMFHPLGQTSDFNDENDANNASVNSVYQALSLLSL